MGSRSRLYYLRDATDRLLQTLVHDRPVAPTCSMSLRPTLFYIVTLLALGGALYSGEPMSATPEAAPDPAQWSFHLQNTDIVQGVTGLHSPYEGSNSLTPNQTRETASFTLFLGARLWDGGALFYNPEYFQGQGLNHTLGVAGFPNGEAQKGGSMPGVFYNARLYFQQTFGFGGETEPVVDTKNQLAGTQDISRLTLRLGKMAASDVLDDNTYSHDPRGQLWNWSLWESGAWDVPAEAKGYTQGVLLEWNEKNWTLRGGSYLMPTEPNGTKLDPHFWKSFGDVAELEWRYTLDDRPGKVRLLGFANRANTANYAQATAHPGPDGLPDVAADAALRLKYGAALGFEQEIAKDLGTFLRLSVNDGHTQSDAFTDIDRSVAFGMSLKGTAWGREDDTVSLAAAVNGLSSSHRAYLAAGGLGILVGDGRLNYATEHVLEASYDIKLFQAGSWITHLAVDYQLVSNPGYNADRGPASIFGMRLHTEF